MEVIKDIVKQFYPILIVASFVLFVVWIYFSATIYGESGIFKGAGTVYKPMLETDELKNEGLTYISGQGAQDVPVVKYNSGAQTVGTSTSFKEMLTVIKADGTTATGSAENGFAIYLMDIKTVAGNSAMEILPTEEIEGLEEIPADFIYDKDQDILYFHGSGIYTVYVKIYGESGGQAVYEFQLPVENQ